MTEAAQQGTNSRQPERQTLSKNPVETGPPIHFGWRHARPPASHPRGKFRDVEGERVASRAFRLTSSKPFTLIEVLFAVIILALALGITLAISANAKGELIRARQRWIIQHALEQATEYCLLANPERLDIPKELLPDGFRAQCRLDYANAAEALPAFAAEVDQYRGWTLGEYTISLYDPSGEFVDEMVVQKLVPAEQ